MIPTTVSLFCGAGGESLGKMAALRALGLDDHHLVAHAVNHWDLAVRAHGRNLPHVAVHQEDITQVTAATYGLDRIQLLWASPSCVHHSRARGGKPKEDQQRSHAWEVTERWLKVAQVDVLLVENVPEFQEWGPLDDEGQPIKDRKGEHFDAWVQGMRDLGYEVDWRVLCAADYGVPTTRRRFFLQAVRDGRGIHWPEPTHRDPRRPAGLFDAALPPWRAAAECIDWSIPVPSIFERRRPLADATLRRIAAGVVRYVLQGKPFIVGVGGRAGQSRPRGLDEPMGTGTTKADSALVAPTLFNLSHGGRFEDLADPMRTVTAGPKGGDRALLAASMVSLRGTAPDQIRATAGSCEAPLPTVSAGGGHAGLVAAFLAKHYGGVVGQGVQQPLGTVTAVDHHSLVAASLIQTGYGEREGQAPRCLDIQAPLGTVVAGGPKHALVAAHLMTNTTGHAPGPLDAPVPALTTGNHQALVAAFIQHYYGTGGQHQDPADPLHTITTLARHGLITVEIDGQTYALVDIGMRMLEPAELARAMGFPSWYDWSGFTKRDQVKMIGNAVPPGLAQALVEAVCRPRPELFGLTEVA